MGSCRLDNGSSSYFTGMGVVLTVLAQSANPEADDMPSAEGEPPITTDKENALWRATLAWLAKSCASDFEACTDSLAPNVELKLSDIAMLNAALF